MPSFHYHPKFKWLSGAEPEYGSMPLQSLPISSWHSKIFQFKIDQSTCQIIKEVVVHIELLKEILLSLHLNLVPNSNNRSIWNGCSPVDLATFVTMELTHMKHTFSRRVSKSAVQGTVSNYPEAWRVLRVR